MDVIIKSFEGLTISELYQIIKLRVDVFVVDQNCAYPELDDKDQESIHYFIFDKDTLVSYLRVYKKEGEQYGLGRIVTREAYRGKGLASKMINTAINNLKEISTKPIYLQAQKHLVAYYSGFGFEVMSEEYLEVGIPHHDMQLLIL